MGRGEYLVKLLGDHSKVYDLGEVHYLCKHGGGVWGVVAGPRDRWPAGARRERHAKKLVAELASDISDIYFISEKVTSILGVSQMTLIWW